METVGYQWALTHPLLSSFRMHLEYGFASIELVHAEIYVGPQPD